VRALAKDCERAVPAVELAHRHQIQSGYQQPNPGSEVKGIHYRVRKINLEGPRHQLKKQRIVKMMPLPRRLHRQSRKVSKCQHSGESNRNDNNETCEWSRQPDINKARREGTGDFILIKAPKVPGNNPGGWGIKKAT